MYRPLHFTSPKASYYALALGREFHFNHRREQTCFSVLRCDFHNVSALIPNTVNKATLTVQYFVFHFVLERVDRV